MNRIAQHVALAAALLCLSATAAAQQVGATLSPAVVAQGQVSEFAITYDGPQTNLDSLPDSLAVPGLDIQGPQTQQSFSMRNQTATFRIELIWQLSAAQPGRFTIPPQTVVFGGQSFTTKELVLEVREGPPPTTSFEPILRLSVEKTDLFVGEVTPISITALFHRRTQLRNYDHPKLPRENVVVKRFPPPGPAPAVAVNGERFQPIEFQSSLSALREGEVVVGPATLDCVVDFPQDTTADTERRPPGFPPSFFQRMNTRQITLTSEPVTLNVKPLPTEGRPEGFGGTVGRFALTTRLAQPAADLRVGDPISVDLIVTGQGNFDSLAVPVPAVTEGWKTYPTKVMQENRGLGLEPGSQVWNQVVVPLQPVSEVPAFVLSFFDPATASYHTVRSNPLPVVVLPELVRPEATTPSDAPAKDFSFVDAALPEEKLNDILALRPPTGRWVPLTPQARDDAVFWAVQAVPAALLLAFAATGWQRRQRERETASQRAREGKPRAPADIHRDLRRSDMKRREFYALAREFVDSTAFYHPRPHQAVVSLNGELSALLERQARYSYAGLTEEADAPVPRPEQKEVLATLDKLNS